MTLFVVIIVTFTVFKGPIDAPQALTAAQQTQKPQKDHVPFGYNGLDIFTEVCKIILLKSYFQSSVALSKQVQV